jgi:prenylcysteine oxidase / farnesylcysteine lyase
VITSLTFAHSDNMVKAANAKVLLNTTVTNIKKEKGNYVVQSGPSKQDRTDRPIVTDMTFDTVVLAAPLQFSGLTLAKDSFKLIPDEIPYVKLHVTLLTTPLKLSRAHFKLKDGAELPTTVLTTLSPKEDLSSRGNMVGKSGFFSISTLKSVTNPKTSRKEYVYKIFSPKKVTEEFLSSLFDIKRQLIGPV